MLSKIRSYPKKTNRLGAWQMCAVAGLLITIAFSLQCHTAGKGAPLAAASAAPVEVEIVSTAAIVSDLTDRNEQLARTDPLAFLQYCLDRHNADVRDYRCIFTKQEAVQGRPKPAQIADVRFRQEPYSVDMTFVTNVGECKRVLYVAGKWIDGQGNELAWAKPGGAILRAFIPRIKQPIHGRRAERASRRTIDQFGFGKTLELVLKYSRKAQAEEQLQLEYVGRGVIDARPTYVFERVLPYSGDERDYPDKLLILHVDEEYLLPTACYCYADEDGQDLLGSYVFSDVKLNLGYSADDFDPDKINF